MKDSGWNWLKIMFNSDISSVKLWDSIIRKHGSQFSVRSETKEWKNGEKQETQLHQLPHHQTRTSLLLVLEQS